jgi:hypothetical protein
MWEVLAGAGVETDVWARAAFSGCPGLLYALGGLVGWRGWLWLRRVRVQARIDARVRARLNGGTNGEDGEDAGPGDDSGGAGEG